MRERSRRTAASLLLCLAASGAAAQDLDDSCYVSALNRTVQVQADGVWVLPNIPANQGPVRVRATCVENGVTRTGVSAPFTLPSRGVVEVPALDFSTPVPIPASLAITAPRIRLSAVGETVQLTVTAAYPDGTTADLTASQSGTDYRSSNPAIASVDAEGAVTARGSGVALLSAANEGALAVLELQVVAAGDSDGDGLPDDWEVANGLDPNDPVDAVDDADGDGLSSADEYQRGLDPTDADTDGDGLSDGREVDEVGTNPLLPDTDGDGLSDGLEVRTGSDPLDPDSFNLAAALRSVEVSPAVSVLVVNTVIGEASRQLRVTGRLIDGNSLDITARRYGTSYSSSDLLTANFGPEDGRVYAGQDGQAVITVGNNGFSAEAQVTIQSFEPRMLSQLAVPGFANAVAVNGTHAYIAAGAAGLQVVDVSNPQAPFIAGALDTPGNANDARVMGGRVYVADGAAGLLIVDVSSPARPLLLGSVATPGTATDVAVQGTWAYVADELGLQIVDVSDPAGPVLAGRVETPGRARGVDVSGGFAVVADFTAGVHVVDVSDPATPRIVGSTHTRPGSTSRAADLVVRDRLAYVADGADSVLGGLRIIDFREPTTPVVVGSTNNQFGLTSVAVERDLVFASDYYFVNAVPIFDVEAAPLFRAVLDFSGPPSFLDDEGAGVAVRDGLVFLAAGCCVRDNGTAGHRSSHLFIGRYAQLDDQEGVPPTATITAPASGSSVQERRTLSVRVDARDDLRVESVQLLVNGTAVATDFAAPYEFEHRVASDDLELRIGAVATDTGGHQGTAEEVLVTVIPDDTPTVEILAPVSGSSWTEGTSIPVAARATDDIGIAGVDILVDGTLQGTLTSPPYKLDVTVPLGAASFTVTAVAADTGGQTVTAARTLTVLTDDPPTSRIVSPPDGQQAVANGLVQVLVGATDDVGVQRVRLLVGGQLEAEDADPPFAFDLQVPAGAAELRLKAVAVDTRGQEATSAEVVLPVASSDPGTTASGLVVDGGGAPVEAAQVACRGVSGTTAADGSFTIPGVPTALGAIRCTATFRGGQGRIYGGTSASVPAVPGGVTNVGTIAIVPLGSSLYPGAKLAMGSGTHAVEIADLNGDGALDLATADHYDGTVSIALGNGDGSFRASSRFDTGGQNPDDLAIADFDEDGSLDIATANLASDDVSVLLGLGDGTFQAGVPFPAGDGAMKLVARDFNGDGHADLAVIQKWASQLSIHFGNGDGTFTLSQTLATGASPSDVDAADLDLDGDLDLVTADFFGTTLSVFNGSAGGAFVPGQGLPHSGRPQAVAARDLDGNGRPDIVAADGFHGRVTVRLALSGGGYGPEQLLEAGGDTNEVLVADFNVDGAPDLAATNEDSNDVSLFLNNGDGTFDDVQSLPAGARPRDLAAADLDGDDVLDIATANFGSEDVALIFGVLGGGFDTSASYPAGVGPYSPSVGDFNGDGAPDLVTASSGTNEVAVLLGRSDGTFVAERRFAVGEDPVETLVADLNGDGKLDIVSANDDTGDLSLLLGIGDGTFAAEQRLPVGDCPAGIASGDLNGDGILDLTASNACDNDVSVLLGTGGGAFAAQSRHAVQEFPLGLVIARLDGDSFLDVAVVNNSYESDVSILRGNGDGTFQAEQRVPLEDGRFPTTLIAGDLDGNGAMDLAVSDSGGYTFYTSVLLGNGDGTFQPEQAYPTGFFPWDLASADLNGDGVLDLAFSKASTDDVSVLLGNGDGTFQEPQLYNTGLCPYGLAVGDVDGNGKMDLITANYCSDDVTVLLHR